MLAKFWPFRHKALTMAKRKAVSLISGGLDSMLATKVIIDQGVHVEGINFFTGFCVEGHTNAIRRSNRTKKKRNNALWVAEQLGIKLHIIDVIEEYKRWCLTLSTATDKILTPALIVKSLWSTKLSLGLGCRKTISIL